MDQLVKQADKAMYEHKRGKKLLSNSIIQGGPELKEDRAPLSVGGVSLIDAV